MTINFISVLHFYRIEGKHSMSEWTFDYYACLCKLCNESHTKRLWFHVYCTIRKFMCFFSFPILSQVDAIWNLLTEKIIWAKRFFSAFWHKNAWNFGIFQQKTVKNDAKMNFFLLWKIFCSLTDKMLAI